MSRRAQLCKCRRRLLQKLFFARVDDQRGLFDLVRRRKQLHEPRKQRQRQIVDAVVVEIFERTQSGRLAGAAHPRNDDDPHSTSSPWNGAGRASAIARLRRSWNSRAEWWPCSLSSMLRAATSMIDVMLRPGRMGIRDMGISTSRIEYVSSSMPRRSY